MTKKRILYTLTKPRVRYYINIWTVEEDNWFIEMTKHKNKTDEEIEYIGMIIEPQVIDWINNYKKRGWIEKK